jgi:hypothetical protein
VEEKLYRQSKQYPLACWPLGLSMYRIVYIPAPH